MPNQSSFRRLLATCVAGLFLLLANACGGGGGSSNVPQFQELILSMDLPDLVPRQVTHLHAVLPKVVDNPPVVHWTTTAGTLGSTTGAMVEFTAPAERGDITVTATQEGDTHSYTMVIHVVPLTLVFDQAGPLNRDAPARVFLSVRMGRAQGSVDWSSSEGTLEIVRGNTAEFVPPNRPGTYTVTARSTYDQASSATFQVIINPQSLILDPSEMFADPWHYADLNVRTIGIPNDSYVWTASEGQLSGGSPYTGRTCAWMTSQEKTGDFRIGVQSVINPELKGAIVVHVMTEPRPMVYSDMPADLQVTSGGSIQLRATTLNSTNPAVVFSVAPDSQSSLPPGFLDPGGVLTAPTDNVLRSVRIRASSVQYPYLYTPIDLTISPAIITPPFAIAGQPVMLGYTRLDFPNLTWNWSTYGQGGGTVTPEGLYSPPAASFIETFDVGPNLAVPRSIPNPFQKVRLPVRGAGPFTPLADGLPQAAMGGWLMRPDGTLILFGGKGSRDVLRVDPATGIVSTLGQTRFHHFGGRAFNGVGNLIFIVGGDEINGWSYVTRMEFFDVEQGVSLGETTLTEAINLKDSFVLEDGRCFILGQSGRIVDPVAGTLGDPIPGLESADPTSIPLASGKFLRSGGQNYGAHLPGDPDLPDRVWLVDPASGSSQEIGHMCRPRYLHAMAEMSDGRILILGGETGDDYGQSDQVEVFDPSTGVSRIVGHMLLVRYQHQVLWLDSTHLMIVGGNPSGLVEIWDVTTNTSRAVGSTALPAEGCTFFRSGDRVLLGTTAGRLESAPVATLVAP